MTAGSFKITAVELDTRARVPDIEIEEFQKHSEDAKKNCPVSRALSSVEITLSAALET
jgi:osmotically inducible protein OsmC